MNDYEINIKILLKIEDTLYSIDTNGIYPFKTLVNGLADHTVGNIEYN